MVDNIYVPDYATLHFMGEPNNVYKFIKFRKQMLEKYLNHLNGTESEFNRLLKLESAKDFDEVYDMYRYTVESLLVECDEYKVGDWFYIEDLYETRQWHGMGRISYDLEKKEKFLVYYGEDTPYVGNNLINIKVFPEWLQNKINSKPDFNKYASKDYLEYLFPEI
jgi:hypothetical protein